MIFARTPFRSAFALLFAIVHVVAAAGASIADGKAEAAAAASAAYAHIEAHGTAECPRVHLEECTLCRVVHAGADRPADAFVPGSASGRVARSHASTGVLRTRPGSGPVHLRGPPRGTAPLDTAA